MISPKIIVAAVLIVLLFMIGTALILLFQRPMAAPLAVHLRQTDSTAIVAAATNKPANTPNVVSTVSAASAETQTIVTNGITPQEVEQTATPIPVGMCGQTGKWVLLITGADTDEEAPPFGLHAFRLVQVDYKNQTIHVVAFPRNILVKANSLKGINRDHERLDILYQLKVRATAGTNRDKNIAATNMLAQLLYENFQVLPDHYFTFQVDSIADMINTIGGVEITLPESMTTDRKVTFPAGRQTLDGELSTEFLRAIEPGGESGRLKRQNLYFTALRTKVLNTGTFAKIPKLLHQFDEALVTDLSPNQITILACAMEKVPPDGIKFYEIANELVADQKDGSLLPVWERIKPMLEEALSVELQ